MSIPTSGPPSISIINAISHETYSFCGPPTVEELRAKMSCPPDHKIYIWSPKQHFWLPYIPDNLNALAHLYQIGDSTLFRCCSGVSTPPSSLQHFEEIKPTLVVFPRHRGCITSIGIRNFKNLGSTTTIVLNGRYTLLVGPNNSGKSSLLKALHVWSTFYNTWSSRMEHSSGGIGQPFSISSPAIGASLPSLFPSSSSSNEPFSIGITFNKQGAKHKEPLNYIFEARKVTDNDLNVRLISQVCPLESRIITVSIGEPDLSIGLQGCPSAQEFVAMWLWSISGAVTRNYLPNLASRSGGAF